MKIPLLFGRKSRLRVGKTPESNCLSPRTKAPRVRGRARRPIRKHGGRTCGKEINTIDKQNARFARILLVNFASQNFGLYARFLQQKQLISPYIFPGDSKLRVNSSAVKMPFFFGRKVASAWERTPESNCLSPWTKAPRAQGRARRPIRTHGGRTYVRPTARKLI